MYEGTFRVRELSSVQYRRKNNDKAEPYLTDMYGEELEKFLNKHSFNPLWENL